jgi:surfeit locus 1 family protein
MMLLYNGLMFSREGSIASVASRVKSIGLLVLVIVLLAVMVNLGFWQLRRFHAKQQLLQHYQQRIHLKPLTWNQFLSVKEKRFYRVTVQGHYLNQKTFLLDHQRYNKQLGYDVITAFQMLHEEKALLVNRGWVPRGNKRRDKPKIKTVNGNQVIEGYIIEPDKKGFILGKNIENQAWPKRIQQLRLSDVSQVTHLTFYPYILRLSPDVQNGFVRKWKLTTQKPAKHLGYAIQWFAMSFVLLVLYLLLFRRKKGLK